MILKHCIILHAHDLSQKYRRSCLHTNIGPKHHPHVPLMSAKICSFIQLTRPTYEIPALGKKDIGAQANLGRYVMMLCLIELAYAQASYLSTSHLGAAVPSASTFSSSFWTIFSYRTCIELQITGLLITSLLLQLS